MSISIDTVKPSLQKVALNSPAVWVCCMSAEFHSCCLLPNAYTCTIYHSNQLPYNYIWNCYNKNGFPNFGALEVHDHYIWYLEDSKNCIKALSEWAEFCGSVDLLYFVDISFTFVLHLSK